MAKLAELARDALASKLESGEELRSVGYFQTGPFWAMILLSNLFAFALKYYYAGVTNKRLIIVRLNSFNKPVDKGNYSIPLTDVELKGNALMVKLPDKEKPVKFNMNFGFQKLSGMDINEFKAALGAR
ncbi:MAG TPA: hypothetical protein VII97_08450 [Anaerolineales bacterium]